VLAKRRVHTKKYWKENSKTILSPKFHYFRKNIFKKRLDLNLKLWIVLELYPKSSELKKPN